MPPTHYDVLEISRTASQDEIRAAYKLLVHRFHPDRNRGSESAARLTQLINDAYRVLSDPGTRAAYDAQLDRTEPHPQPAPPSDAPDKPHAREDARMSRAPERAASATRFQYRGRGVLWIGVCAIAAGLLLKVGTSLEDVKSGFSIPAGRATAVQAGGSARRSDERRSEASGDNVRASAPAPDARPRISKDDEVTIGIACRPLQSTGDGIGYDACIARQRAVAAQTPAAPDSSDDGVSFASSLACRFYQLNGDVAGHRECVRRESAESSARAGPREMTGPSARCVEVTTRDRTYMQCE